MMKFRFEFALLLSLMFSPFCAEAQDWTELLRKVKRYPSQINQAETLQRLVENDFDSDRERAAAYYAWIGKHIIYDCEAFHQPPTAEVLRYRNKQELEAQMVKLRDKRAQETLDKGSAICHGYTQLYQKLCSLSGIKCEIINGYARNSEQDIGKLPGPSDHAWNAVCLDGIWQLVDVTWAAGSIVGNCSSFRPDFTTVYFMCAPKDFFLKHFPEDTAWLLTEKNADDFAAQPYYYTEYLKIDLKISSPRKGLVRASSSQPLEIHVESSSPPAELGYAYDSYRYAERFHWQKNDKGYIGKVAPSTKVNDILTLYYKGNAIVSYKVQQ